MGTEQEKKPNQPEWVFSAARCFWRGELIFSGCTCSVCLSKTKRGPMQFDEKKITPNRNDKQQEKRRSKIVISDCVLRLLFYFLFCSLILLPLCSLLLFGRMAFVCVYILCIYRLSFVFSRPVSNKTLDLVCMAEMYAV